MVERSDKTGAWVSERGAVIVVVAAILATMSGAALAQDDEADLQGVSDFVFVAYAVDEEEEPVGPIHRYEDNVEDAVNPIFNDSVDYLDTTLPLWDVLEATIFSVRSDESAMFAEGDNLVHIEPGPGDDYVPRGGGYTFYGRYAMLDAVDNREPLGTHWCNVAVHARSPDRRTTIQASVINDDDPASGTNLAWKTWFGPQGEMFTSKTQVNEETGVVQAVATHATVAVVEDNVVTIVIPADEFEGVDRIVLSAGCTPLEYTEYTRHTFDAVADVMVDVAYFDPAWVFEGVDEPIVDTSIRTAVTDSIAPVEDEGDSTPDPVAADADAGAAEELLEQLLADEATSEARSGDSDGRPIIPIVVGISAIAAGAYLYVRSRGVPE